jgi:predicted nucleic acid-binding protein
MILVDSSVWVAFFNGRKRPAVDVLQRLIEKEEDVCLSEYILMEVLQGFRKDKAFHLAYRCLRMFPIYAMKGMSSYIAAAEMYRACRKKGITVRSAVDCLIARMAIENEWILLHDDADFDHIASIFPLQLFTASSLTAES